MKPFLAHLQRGLPAPIENLCCTQAAGENIKFSLLHHDMPSKIKKAPHWELACHESERLIFIGYGLIWNWIDSTSALPCTFFQRFEADYLAAGIDFLCSLTGQFGFVLYDKQQEQLFAFRDQLGYHMLYYLEQDGEIFISPRASQLYPFQKDKQLSLIALKMFFKFGFIVAPHTPIEGVVRILPGEYITCKKGGSLTHHRYWTPPPFVAKEKSDDYFVQGSYRELWAALRRNLNGANKVGVFLSGGIDSAVFAGMLAQLDEVETAAYTFGLDIFHPRVDYQSDVPYARMVAQRHNLFHKETILDQSFSIAHALCEAIPTYDVPYVTPNMITKRLMAQQAYERGIDVVITGSGSSGPYVTVPDNVIASVNGTREAIYALAYKARARFLSDDRLHQIFPQTEFISDPQMWALFAPYFEGIEVNGGDSYVSGLNYTFGSEKIINLHHLIGDGAGVKIQMPFIDYDLWEFRSQAPGPLRGSDNSYPEKFLLVEPFRDLLPEAVITRTKAGYPSYYWYRGELDELHQRLFSDGVRQHLPLINLEAARRIFKEELGSRRKSAGKVTWGVTVFLLWHLHFVKGWDVRSFMQ